MIVDYKDLINRLNKETYWLGSGEPYSHDVHPVICDEAIKAIKELLERAEKAEKQRDELFNLLNDICKDMRETHVDDSVCGLCEYDATHSSENGDCINECPGFDRDDCFCMKKSLREKYGQKEE